MVAIPVDAILRLLPKLLDLIDQQIIVDVGSTKETILSSIKDHPKRPRFIASHPMAGTEFSGPEAALPDLFDHKCAVICEIEKCNPLAQELAKSLYKTLGMKLIPF